MTVHLSERAQRKLLAACCDCYLDGLRDAFSGMLDRLDDALFELAERGETEERRGGYFDVMRELRLTRADLLQRFQDLMRAVWDGAPEPGSALLEQAENMALTLAVRCAEAECGEVLAALRRAMVPLASRAAPQALAPRTLYGAFEQVCAGIEASVAVRLILLKFFERHVGAILPALYRQVLDVLEGTASGTGAVTPAPAAQEIVHGAPAPRKGGVLAPADQSGAGAGGWAGVLGAAGLGGGAVGAELGQLLQQVVRGEGTAGQVEVLKLLATQQHSDHDGIRSRTASLDLSRVAGDGGGNGISVHLLVDMLALLYDGLYVDRGVHLQVKVHLARLQLPLFKLALRDPGFLARRSHVARRFFNALVALGRAATMGFSPSDEQRLTDLMDDVAERCVDDPEVFATAAATLASLAPTRAAPARPPNLDRLEEAEREAQREMDARTTGRALPALVSALLEGHWRRHLVELYLRHGPQGSSWRRALGTADALLWAISARDTPDAAPRLAELRPRLIRQLRAGFDELGLATAEQELLYTELRRLLDEGSYAEAPASEIELADLTQGDDTAGVIAITNSAGQEVVIEPDDPAGGDAGMFAEAGPQQDTEAEAQRYLAEAAGGDEPVEFIEADTDAAKAPDPKPAANAPESKKTGKKAGLSVEAPEFQVQAAAMEPATGSEPELAPENAGGDPVAELLRSRGVDADTLVIEEIVLVDTPGLRGEVLPLNRDRHREEPG